MSTIDPTGIYEGITSAIGQEINRLGGTRSTRIQAGHPISSGDTTFRVETTTGWESTGFFYLEGVLYKYTGITSSPTHGTFTGISHFDGLTAAPISTGPYISGAAQDHEVLSEIIDYTRIYSALDQMRRTFLVDYATGSDLDTVGRNIGVLRQPELPSSDSTFRNIIKAIAYSPRGTMYAVELYLTALFGAGNYKIFEDLTNSGYEAKLGSTAPNHLAGSSSVNHPAQIFISTSIAASTTSAGKAYALGDVVGQLALVAPSASTTSVTLLGDYPYNHTPKVIGCQLRDEGGERIVIDALSDSSAFTSNISVAWDAVTRRLVVTMGQLGTANPTDYIQVGDRFQIAGQYDATDFDLIRGLMGLKTMGTVIAVAPGVGGGFVYLGVDSEIDCDPFIGKNGFTVGTTKGYRIIRNKTRSGYYKPSLDRDTEGEPDGASGGGGTPDALPTRQWTFSANGTGTTEASVTLGGGPPNGQYSQLRSIVAGVGGDDVFYRQEARILPRSVSTFEAKLDFEGNFATGTADQFQFVMRDGDPFYALNGRKIQLGLKRDASTPGSATYPVVNIGFSNAAGSFIGSSTYQHTGGTPHIYKLVKHGEDKVEFYVDGVLIDSLSYSSFTAGSSVDQSRLIGVSGTSATGGTWTGYARIHWMNWTSDNNETDLTNIRIMDASLAQDPDANYFYLVDDDTLALLGSVPAGSRIRISYAGAFTTNYPGSVKGEYEVGSVINANTLQFQGYKREANANVSNIVSSGTSVTRKQVRIGATQRGGAGHLQADEPYSFIFPQDLGKKIRIYTGASYEEKTITKILNPNNGLSVAAPYGIDESGLPRTYSTLAQTSLPEIASNLCEVDSDFSSTYQNATWSIEPPGTTADIKIEFEVIQQASYVGTPGTTVSTLTLPKAYTKPAAYISDTSGPRVAAKRTNIISAQVLDPDRDNTVQSSPPAYDFYPLYLTGSQLGSALSVLQDVLTAAGVHVNLKPYYIDGTGDHII
jgi:hypothetical protein